uniref:Uncharacterized protein n=1 Tax=Colobus angolensis palliatus TaxID=336983 RepID=A0A2K5I160_COLAP
MSLQAPPRLLELAEQSLLRDGALAIPTLEELPRELFPSLFIEAFTRRCCEALKTMVQAWPFPCLPLGSLMKLRHLETFRAVLEGLDALLAQQVPPRRWKLQVLDLRDVDENFWGIRSGASAPSPEALSKRQTAENCPRLGEQQPLMVTLDLCFKDGTLDECLTWGKQRKGLLHVCCKELQIFGMPIHSIIEVLNVVELDCIQEVEVCCPWELSILVRFAPYLGQMRNLRKLVLFNIHVSACIPPDKKEQLVTQFTSQFLKLDYFQKLYMHSVSFLEGHLDQLLRCLQAPLETVVMTDCLLSESDLKHLSRCPSIHQLKELDLRGITLTHFSPEPLAVLLEQVEATLQTLDLEDCGIMDSQLSVILPALSRCSQLSTLSFCGNLISVAALENLLRHTVGLSKLSLELYPAPLESYDAQGALCWGRFAQLGAELMKTLRDLRQPKIIVFSTVPCPRCGIRASYDLEPSHCLC